MNHLPVFKSLFIGFISISSLVSSKNSFAQSIVGKWYQVTVKQYLTDEGAKKYGKLFIVTDMSTIGTVISEFRSNHTYTTTSDNKDGASRTYSGSWSMDGNVLTMTDEKATAAVQSTVTVKSGVLVMETLHPDSKISRKVEITFKKG
jgi:Lipocalin-like domain